MDSIRIKAFCILVVTAVLAAGCDGSRPETTSAATEPAKTGARPASDSSKLLDTPLPGGFELPFAYHAREDRVVTLDNGVVERRVLVDALDGDVGQVREALTAAFKEAGMAPTRPVEQRGGQRVSYRDESGRRVSVTTWSRDQRKPQAKAAQAVVYLGWALESAPTQ